MRLPTRELDPRLTTWTWRLCLLAFHVVILGRINPNSIIGPERASAVWVLGLQFAPLFLASAVLLLTRPTTTLRLQGLLAAALVAFCALTTLWSVSPGRTAPQAVLMAVGFGFIYLTATRRWGDRALLRGDLLWIALVGGATVALGVLLRLIGVWFTVGVSGRLQGVMGNANYLGMLVVLTMSLLAFALGERMLSRVQTRWAGAAFGFLVVTLVWTGSRGAVVALTAGILAAGFAWLLRSRRRPSWPRLLPFALVAALVCAVVWFAAPSVEPPAVTHSAGREGSIGDVFNRKDIGVPSTDVTAAGQQGEDLTTGRVAVWKAAAKIGLKHPVQGSGYRTGELLLDGDLTAHNLWLSFFMETGLVGTLLLLALVLSLVLPGIRVWQVSLVVPCVIILAQELVESSLQAFGGPVSLVQWLVLFACAAAASQSARPDVEREAGVASHVYADQDAE